MNLEKVVRPFQTPVVTPPRRVATSGASSAGGPQSITIGGTANSGDQLVLTITSTSILGSPVTLTVTLTGGDTLATAALALVDAVNGDAGLQAAGITAAIVPTRPLELTVAQPTSLNPQATFNGSAIGTTTMTLAGGNVAISPGRKGSPKTMNSSFNGDTTFYTKKWPKEMTLQDALAEDLPFVGPIGGE